MAVGELLNTRKVTITMSHKIMHLNHGQGFTSNLVTPLLIIFASRLSLPVFTNHISVGSLFGIGLVSRQADPCTLLSSNATIAAFVSRETYRLITVLSRRKLNV